MANLSKSRFVSGNQCEKKLFFDIYRKDLKPAITPEQQKKFDTGHLLGHLAQSVFPRGIDATEGINGNWSLAIERTKTLIENKCKTIYEATFSTSNSFAALDILHQTEGELWAIEVKSSASVKEYHLIDAAFQLYVMNQVGVYPDKFYLMHINSQYVKSGEINASELFHLEEITEVVRNKQEETKRKHLELVNIIDAKVEPNKTIGKHCLSPFSCDYKDYCWAHIPENSVFELVNARGKEWDLYEQGIITLDAIPDDFLGTYRQNLQINGAKKNSLHIDLVQIKKFLKDFTGKLYFFDFETINPAIPIIDRTRPFQQVPFQYSLHTTDENGDNLKHYEFLADVHQFTNTNYDPRLELIQSLEMHLKEPGLIVAYNATFEKTIINALAKDYPEYGEFLESLNSRFIDLLIPFRNAWYYHPEMGASASIKSVLPVINKDFSYSNLEIQNGGSASTLFLEAALNKPSYDIEKLRVDLLKYCERDTEGMVIIYRHLKAL